MQDLSQMSTEELLRMRQAAQRQPAQQPMQPTRAPGIIQGNPKPPPMPTPQTPVQAARDETGLTLDQIKIENEDRDRQEEERKRRGLMEGYQRAGQTVLRSTTRALEYLDKMQQGGGFIPAASRGVQSKIIGTDEYQFTRQIEDLKRNIGLDRLQQMRDNSPTGGALGQVPVQQQAMLEDTLGSFDITQPGETLRENLNQLNNIYLDIMFGSPAERAEAVAAGRMTAQEAEQIEQYYRDTEFDLFGRRKSEGQGGDEPDDGILRGRVTDDSPAREGEPGFVGPGGGGSGGPDPLMTGLAQGAGDLVQDVGDTVGMFTDPFARLLADALGYDGSQMQSLGTNLREGVGLPESPDGVGREVRRFATGALAGGGAARGLSTLTSPGVTQNVLNVVGRTPIRDTVAGAGAGAGAAVGEEVGGTPGQIVGMLAGGLGGYGAANATMRAAAPRAPNALAQDADRLDIQLLPADAGGTATRMATGAVGRTFGGIPIAEGAQASTESAGRAAQRIAGRVGDVTDRTGAGQAARRGFNTFEKTSLQRGEELYQRVSVPAERPVSLQATRSALEEVTRGFKSNPELSKLWADHPRLRATLEALTPEDVAGPARKEFMRLSFDLAEAQKRLVAVRNSTMATPADKVEIANQVEDLTRRLQAAQRNTERMPVGGELSWEDMSRFRSIVGEIVGKPSMTSDGADIKALRKLYGAITNDMEATANAVGGKAAQEWSRATQYWRGRQGRIDDVFATLLGPDGKRGEERVFNQINAWAQNRTGDFGRLAKTIRSMPKDEADTVRATIVSELGKAPPSRQSGAAGDVFSVAEFSKQWQGLSSRAKNVLFPNKQHRDDLEALARISEEMKGATQYQNFSNTALGANFTATGLTGMSGFTGMLLAGGYSGASYALGKLLASPKFARILARTAKMPPEAANRSFTEQLGILATREPGLQGDINALMQAVNDNGRLAAGQEQQQD